MIDVETKVYHGEYGVAEVTRCRIGAGGWHIHTTYTTDEVVAGLCGDAPTQDAADMLYAQARRLARLWARQH